MAQPEDEIVVDDPGAPEGESPALTTTRSVEVGVYLVLLGVAFVLGFDNWRAGIGWAPDGPRPGYLPFYLCVILAGASLYGLAISFLKRGEPAKTFVTRDQFRRVLQVFVPTFLFCLLTEWLGIYVASFLLIAGFMRFVGRLAWWKSLLTAIVFAVAMFVTFDVAFDVIMPKGPVEAAFGF